MIESFMLILVAETAVVAVGCGPVGARLRGGHALLLGLVVAATTGAWFAAHGVGALWPSGSTAHRLAAEVALLGVAPATACLVQVAIPRRAGAVRVVASLLAGIAAAALTPIVGLYVAIG